MIERVVVVEPVVVTVERADPMIVTAGVPGLQGPPGPPDADSLKVYNRLAEFDTPDAKAAARANLELQHIDCGEF